MEFNEERNYSDLDVVSTMLFSAKGKTFRALDKTGRGEKSGNKGALGQIVEESVLHYPINSDAQPDIQIGGVGYELKVTPLKHLKNGMTSAKERLVLDIINYLKLPSETFENSQFWRKSRNIIIVYYYDDRGDKHESILDSVLLDAFLLNYDLEDLKTIQEDWAYIQAKVAEGKADQLSESDTTYLAACTKGATAASSLRDAPAPPDSDTTTIRAKQRAFSYKASYMTKLARQRLSGTGRQERLPMSPDQSLNEFVRAKTQQYIGKTVREITQDLGLPTTAAKSANSILALRMLGSSQKSVGKIEQFAAANVTMLKTVVIYQNGRPEQNMSFPYITQEQWAELGDAGVAWHDSFIYRFFEENKFLIADFQAQGRSRRKDSGSETDTFAGTFLWNMPETDIEQYVQPVWRQLHDVLVRRESVNYCGEGPSKLPGQAFNHVFHIRPHGRNSADTVDLPNDETIPKQSFWLDRNYVAQVVNEQMNAAD